jgi:hypothetical protein
LAHRGGGYRQGAHCRPSVEFAGCLRSPTRRDSGTISRQTVNNELGALVEAGVTEMSYKHITLPDAEKLRLMANAD